jgi:hypothetical protein
VSSAVLAQVLTCVSVLAFAVALLVAIELAGRKTGRVSIPLLRRLPVRRTVPTRRH